MNKLTIRGRVSVLALSLSIITTVAVVYMTKSSGKVPPVDRHSGMDLARDRDTLEQFDRLDVLIRQEMLAFAALIAEFTRSEEDGAIHGNH